jgi:tetratricopeptide (TPR) repeat protein
MLLAFLLAVGWVLLPDTDVRQFRRNLENGAFVDLERMWSQWLDLSQESRSSGSLLATRQIMRAKFLTAVEQVLLAYRQGDETVYEKDWERAASLAGHALALEPDDATRGGLRLCEGHIARIHGTEYHRAADLNQAVGKFLEAQRLLPQSTDPQLGLAQVYLNGLKDVDKGERALNQAGWMGYTIGNRENLQLAEGYRDRGGRLFFDSRNLRGLPPEREQLERAQKDYERALQLYRKTGLPGADASMATVQSALDNVNARLLEIDRPKTPAKAKPKRAAPNARKKTPAPG